MNINIAIQSLVLTVYVLKFLLYMLQRDQRKAPIIKLSHSKAPSTQQAESFNRVNKTSKFFSNRDGTFAPARYLAYSSSFAKVFVFCKVYNSINVSRNYRLCRNGNFPKQSFRGRKRIIPVNGNQENYCFFSNT